MRISAGTQARLVKTNAWIGLRLAAQKSRLWIWTDGSPVNYSKWAPEEPHTWSAKEGCAQIFNATKDYDTHKYIMWSNYICSEQLKSFVCKVKKVKKLPSVKKLRRSCSTA
ncbi:lectin C-type domain protein [Teladorsagia circumcincta]|uniref:Lectin C-type domain protein n=1 Tax=Teladorsagia circumcincta TaxID=45464 RepID=A0A2G9UZN4_TELCI|nr:lectin C-type domain protein [Teladorsagia circumcincta]